jgi:hypothetical protein
VAVVALEVVLVVLGLMAAAVLGERVEHMVVALVTPINPVVLVGQQAAAVQFALFGPVLPDHSHQPIRVICDETLHSD